MSSILTDSPRRRRWGPLSFMAILVSYIPMPTAAQITLAVDIQTGGDIILTWIGGVPNYNLLMGTSADLSAGVQFVLKNSALTSSSVTMPAETVFFRVGDATAPTATVTSPKDGVTTTNNSISVSGSIDTGVSQIFVNGSRGQPSGSTFSAGPVPLAIGPNTLHAVAVAADGNISLTTSQVSRVAGNIPPTLEIVSPGSAADLATATPMIQVSYSDVEGLDLSTFHAYLDGTEQTSKFQPVGAAMATWQVEEIDSLPRGSHEFQVTIRDTDGFTQSAGSHFRIKGPRLDSVSPDRASPGALVTLTGAGLGMSPVAFFNGVAATTQAASATQVIVQVPSGATDGDVVVQSGALTSNPLPFDIAFTSAGGPSSNVAIDSLDRVYYKQGTDHIQRLEQDGAITPFFVAPTGDEITGIVFDPAGTTLYVATRGDPTVDGGTFIHQSGRIWAFPVGGSGGLILTLPASGAFSDPSGIDVKLIDGILYLYLGVVEGETKQTVIRVDLNTLGVEPLNHFPASHTLISDVKADSIGAPYAIYNPDGLPPILTYAGGVALDAGDDIKLLVLDCNDDVFMTEASGNILKQAHIDFFSREVVASVGPIQPHGIDLDSKGNLFVGSNTAVQRVLGFRDTNCANDFQATLTGDSPKILASFDPTIPGESPNVQFVILTACLDDPSIPRQPTDQVLWSWEDVDDPATDVDLDTNGPAGGDNLSRPFLPPFTQEGTYTLQNGPPVSTAYDAAGCSKVRFHVSAAPGDNFQVMALLATQLGSRSVTSQIMTVWRRLHVELDSMGDVTGPVGEDDAVIGDIPPPDPGLLAAVFAPAYIEIVLDGPGSNTDVAFDAHVPDVLGSMPDAEVVNLALTAQGVLGRDGLATPGVWRAYAQGTYEGGEDEDFDPDSETGYALGRTNRDLGKYSFIYTETIRDLANSTDEPSICVTRDESYLRQATLVHELAHQFGVPDPDPMTSDGSNGIMEANSELCFPYFTPKQLRTIRNVGEGGKFPGALD